MAPVLEKVAPLVEGKMSIGTIDCTVQKSLCNNEFKVKGFPTLKYSIDGEIMDYSGGREVADLVTFAKKMSGPAVHVVSNYEQAMAFATKETLDGVAFLGFDPKSSPSEMTELHLIYKQVARKRQASAYFLWLENGEEERKYPFIHKIESNLQPKSYADRDTDIASVTLESLGGWVQANNVPLVSELDGSNFNRIGRNGRPLVLSIVDFDRADQKAAVKKHMLSYASSLSTKEAEKYYFGIMDGNRWEKFLEQFSINRDDNPQMLIMDVPTKMYHQNETYKNVFDFMKAVEAGEIPSRKATKSNGGGGGILANIESFFVDNLPYSIIIVIGLVFGIVFLLVPSEGVEPPFDRVTDEGEIIGDDDDDDDDVVDVTPVANESKKDK